MYLSRDRIENESKSDFATRFCAQLLCSCTFMRMCKAVNFSRKEIIEKENLRGKWMIENENLRRKWIIEKESFRTSMKALCIFQRNNIHS